ncbi:MAG: PAS domain-containing sensor histidine kinase [Cenarchaeum sp. SB0666_bin_15]|nr:PAS domain-containing sensor histidine kinase [Cenarchaeum sp. SB0666_bin_15]
MLMCQSSLVLSSKFEKRVSVRKTLEPMTRSVDLQGRIIDCNDKYARMLGYVKDEVVGMSIFEHTPEESHPKLQMIFDQWKNHESVNNRRFPLITRSGNIFDVLITVGDVFGNDGMVIRSRTTLLDYQEVQDLQELVKLSKYESLYEYSPDMYRTVNIDGIIIHCNNKYAETMGYEKSEIIGRNLVEHTADRSVSDILINMARWRASAICETGEIWMKPKNGNEFPATVSPTNLFDDNGALIGRNVVIQDITKTLETTKMLEERRKIDQMKDEFLTGITHELKTPLTPIIGFSQALSKPGMLGDLNEKQSDAVNTILSNATHLRQLVTDLLDIHKLELGRMKFKMSEFEIKELLASVKSSVTHAINEKNMKLKITANTNGKIIGDQFRIDEVMTNMLYNAIDFSPRNTGVIEIIVEKEAEMIKISIKDNGSGIPDDKQAELFNKFYQITTSINRRHGGTGLGLSICKGLAEGMGGAVGVISKEGKGSTFYFTINPTGVES